MIINVLIAIHQVLHLIVIIVHKFRRYVYLTYRPLIGSLI